MDLVMTYNRSFRILHQASEQMLKFDICSKGIKGVDYYTNPGFYPGKFYSSVLFVESLFTPTSSFLPRNTLFPRNEFITSQVYPVYVLNTGINFTPGDTF